MIRGAFFLISLTLSVASFAQDKADKPDNADNANVLRRYQDALSERVRSVAEATLPSVVTIEVIGIAQSNGEVRQDAPTSGVILDADGHVLASSMVSTGPAASILVGLPGGDRAPAKVIARDEHRDLVLLKIDPAGKTLQPLSLSATEPAKIGQKLIAVARYGASGQPMVSTGILSAVDRLDGTAIQTDARVSPAFYGGPLVDLNGNVRGILIPAVGEGGGEEATAWYDAGVAFAIPNDVIAAKLDRLRSGETIRQGLLGIIIGGSDPYAPGTKLSAVRTRSPAEKAGLRVGDQIVAVGGRPVRRRQELKLALGRFDAGDEVVIESLRDGRTMTTTVTLVETIPPVQPQSLGIAISARDQGSDKSVWIIDRVLTGGPADGVLQPGDQITSIAGQPIDDLAGLRQRLWTADADKVLRVEIARDGKEESVEMQPRSWAGPIDPSILEFDLAKGDAAPWRMLPLQLTDVPNQARLWCPPDAKPDNAPEQKVGMLVVLAAPNDRDCEAVLESWKPVASKWGVAVCVIASESDERWRISEIDAIAKITAAAIKQSSIDASCIAVTGPAVFDASSEPGPADSMALAVGLSTTNIFSGVAISTKTQPPAVQIKPDDPLRMIRVLFPLADDAELPTWSATLTRIGCPVQTIAAVDREVLLRWTRSLQWF